MFLLDDCRYIGELIEVLVCGEKSLKAKLLERFRVLEGKIGGETA